MYSDYGRAVGIEPELRLCFPAGHGRSVHLMLIRRAGPDFSARDRALLALLRPRLYQAYRDAERRRRGIPALTPRQWDLMRLVAKGHSNAQIARRLGLSLGTVASTRRTSMAGCRSPAALPLSPVRSRSDSTPSGACRQSERRSQMEGLQSEGGLEHESRCDLPGSGNHATRIRVGCPAAST
jgi:DNA-binding CsgD family transcriptional regulator